MLAVGTRLGRWRVIGHHGALSVVVDHFTPTLRYRLAKISDQATSAEQDAWLTLRHPVFAARIDALEHAGQMYWVLDDVDAWPLSSVMLDEGRADLTLIAVVAVDLLEALADVEGDVRRWITPWTVGIDRRGHTRLRPHWIDTPQMQQGPFVVSDPSEGDPEIYGVAATLSWLFCGVPPDRAVALEPRPDVPQPVIDAINRALLRDTAYGWFWTPSALLGAIVNHLPPRRESRARVRDLMSRFEPTVPVPWLNELAGPLPPAPKAATAEPEIALPAALDPWRESLAIFPPDLALGLGTAVRRFARIVGPLALETDARAGTPDGYRGVTRRGPFERLLLSEWALLLEIPEEFVRRAAMGEQLHHAMAYKEPGGARRSIALFDAGPRSLGRPRVAQLAILIVLAERARAARVPFGWGLLQDGRRSQISELNAASVTRFLTGRTHLEATAIDGAEWAISLGAPAEADDLWLVGPPGIEQEIALGGGTRVLVSDRLELGARSVDVSLVRPGAVVRSVELELPPEQSTVRLLRDPFQARRTPERAHNRAPLVGPLVMSPDGRRAIAFTSESGSHGIAVLALPRTAREKVAGPIYRASAPGTRMVAATFADNRTYTAELDHRGLRLCRYGPHGGASGEWPLANADVLPLADAFEDPSPDLAVYAPGGEPAMAWLRGGTGVLWQWSSDFTRPPQWSEIAMGVKGLVTQQHASYFTTVKENGEIELCRLMGRDPRSVFGRWEGSGDGALVMGAGAVALPGPGVAVQIALDEWIYGEGPQAKQLLADPAGKVVSLGMVEGQLVLIDLHDSGRDLRVDGRVILRFEHPIVSIAPNPCWPTLGCLDSAGTLRVVGLDGRIKHEVRG